MPDTPPILKNGCIVTGVDTDAGKTIAAAVLVSALNASYWKPLQTGLNLGIEADDAATVQALTGCEIHPNAYRLQQPLSPAAAAEIEGITIEPATLVRPSAEPLVIEGAGGVLVPITEQHLLIDVFNQWELPVVVVITGKLGGVNHALLTLDTLNSRQLPVAGLLLNGDDPRDNVAAIIQHTPQQHLPVWRLPSLTPLNARTVKEAARQIFCKFS